MRLSNLIIMGVGLFLVGCGSKLQSNQGSSPKASKELANGQLDTACEGGACGTSPATNVLPQKITYYEGGGMPGPNGPISFKLELVNMGMLILAELKTQNCERTGGMSTTEYYQLSQLLTSVGTYSPSNYLLDAGDEYVLSVDPYGTSRKLYLREGGSSVGQPTVRSTSDAAAIRKKIDAVGDKLLALCSTAPVVQEKVRYFEGGWHPGPSGMGGYRLDVELKRSGNAVSAKVKSVKCGEKSGVVSLSDYEYIVHSLDRAVTYRAQNQMTVGAGDESVLFETASTSRTFYLKEGDSSKGQLTFKNALEASFLRLHINSMASSILKPCLP